MKTSVATEKIVSITMSVDEWAEWLAIPQTLLVKIQNLALEDVEPASNGKKPRKSPKASTRRKSKKTIFYECPQCDMTFYKEGNLKRHIEREHAVQPVTD